MPGVFPKLSDQRLVFHLVKALQLPRAEMHFAKIRIVRQAHARARNGIGGGNGTLQI